MCWCNPNVRTPNCGSVDCVPPISVKIDFGNIRVKEESVLGGAMAYALAKLDAMAKPSPPEHIPPECIPKNADVAPFEQGPLIWKREAPTVAGSYLFKNFNEWGWRVRRVAQGSWQRKQNPEWLYPGSTDETPVQDMEGWWLGPLPEIPGEPT